MKWLIFVLMIFLISNVSAVGITFTFNDVSSIHMTPIGTSGNLTVVSWCDKDSNHLTFQVFDPNRKNYTEIITVEEEVSCTGDNNPAVEALDTETFVFAYFYDPAFGVGNEPIKYRIFNRSGADLTGGKGITVHKDVNKGDSISVAAFNEEEFIITYKNNKNKSEMFSIANRTKVLIGNITIGEDLAWRYLSNPRGSWVDTFDGNKAIAVWFNDNDNDMEGMIINRSGANLTGVIDLCTTCIDLNAIHVSTLNSTLATVAYPLNNGLSIQVKSHYVDTGLNVLGTETPDLDSGLCEAVETTRINESLWAVIWTDHTDDDVTGRIYDYDGNLIENDYDFRTSEQNDVVAILSHRLVTNRRVCDDNIIAAWGVDSPTQAELDGFASDFGSWGATCTSCEYVETTGNWDINCGHDCYIDEQTDLDSLDSGANISIKGFGKVVFRGVEMTGHELLEIKGNNTGLCDVTVFNDANIF